jgi:hypothetical protein
VKDRSPNISWNTCAFSSGFPPMMSLSGWLGKPNISGVIKIFVTITPSVNLCSISKPLQTSSKSTPTPQTVVGQLTSSILSSPHTTNTLSTPSSLRLFTNVQPNSSSTIPKVMPFGLCRVDKGTKDVKHGSEGKIFTIRSED